MSVLGWIGFVILFVYATLIGGGWAGIYLVQLRIASLAMIAVVLSAWFVGALWRPAWRPGTAIWPTLVIPIAVLAITTMSSRFPRLGVEYVAWAVLLVALYLLLVRVLGTEFARARIGGLAAMMALVIGLLYLGTVFQLWIEWWELVGRLVTPPLRPLYGGLSLGGPAAVLSVVLGLAVVAFAGLGTSGRGRRLILALVAVVTLAVAIVSGSRGGWIALAVAVGAIGALWMFIALRRGSLTPRLRRGWHRVDVRVATVVGVVILVLAVVVVAPSVLQRIGGAGDGGRWQYYAAAERMFEDAPILGTGPGTWAVQRAAYTRPGELDWYIPHAHNVVLQSLSELGLVGALAGLVALLPVGWLIIRGLRSSIDSQRRWAWAGLFLFVYLAIYGMVDFYLNFPAFMLVAVIPIAVLDATTIRGLGVGRRARRYAATVGRVARLGLALGCIAAVLVLARVESVALTHQAAVGAIAASDWQTAEGLADEASKADPDMTAYQVTRGLVASQMADWQSAENAFGRAVSVDDLPQSWLGLAQAQAALGAPQDRVVDSIEHALRIGRRQASVLYAAANLYDRSGLQALADDAYADAIVAFPSLAGDPTWTGARTLEPRFESILGEAMDRAPQRAWEMALMAGATERARSLNVAAGSDEVNGLVIDAWAGDDAALRRLYALADANPDSARLLSWGSRLAGRLGDAERAARYQRLAVFAVAEGGALPGTEIRVDVDGWQRYVPAGTLARFAGHYLYRRPLGDDLLPPGLPRLVNAPLGGELADEPPDTPRPSMP